MVFSVSIAKRSQLPDDTGGFSDARASGSLTRNRLPFPNALSTCTSAPCAVQTDLTIERPRPAPPSSRERALSTRKKRSKTCGTASGGIPIPTAVGRVLDGVIEEIDDDLFEARAVSLHDDVRLRIALDRNALVLREQAHLISGRGGEFGEIELHPFALGFAGVQPRQGNQALDDIREALNFLQHAPERVVGGFVDARVLREIFHFAAQDGQRRAQFVRGIGDEPFGILNGVLQPANHVIERNGKALHFITGARDGQTLAEIVLGNLLGLVADLLDGPERAMDKKIAAHDRRQQRHRQSTRKQHEQMAQHCRDGIERLAHFDKKSLVIGRCIVQRRDQERAAIRQSKFLGEFFCSGRRKRGQMRGIKTLIFGRPGGVKHRAIGARYADEAIVYFRLITILDFMRDIILPLRMGLGKQRVGDLLGAAGLGFAEIVFEKMPQIEIHDRAQQNKNAGQQACVPGNEAKTERARVHVSTSSLRQ
jgi:hypothetical protein